MIETIPKAFVALLLCSVFHTTSSAELRVDINNSNRPVSEGLAPGFTPWAEENRWYSGSRIIAQSFGEIRAEISVIEPTRAAFSPGYWKAGVQNSDLNVKLIGDGIKVEPDDGGDRGAVVELRLTGLAPGPHTLVTYHNAWDNFTPSLAPQLQFELNGERVPPELTTTVRGTSPTEVASALFSFEVLPNQDVVLEISADTTVSAANYNVYLNGFEVDTASPKRKATEPIPSHSDEHVAANDGTLLLQWKPAPQAVTHHLFLATNLSNIREADIDSPYFMGSTPTPNFKLTHLNSHRTYYWRVDEADSQQNITQGDIWSFRPRQLAFPGAEGYGRFARGGRDGIVVKVTNLNDRGPGSFRAAIEEHQGPRTIVFDVAGLITLESDLILGNEQSYITIAGQTAPGNGICVRKHQFGMSGATDVICRFIRSRPGDISGVTLNGSGMAGVDHTIMDHCSISWGLDELMSTRNAKNVTLQRTLLSEALNVAGHDKYPPNTAHGFAASVGGDIASLHHNLLAHCEGRNWSLAGGLDGDGLFAGRLDIFNNVVYNWGKRTTDGGAHEVNFVNNYYQAGPAKIVNRILIAQYENFPGTQRYYYAGNVMPGTYSLDQQDRSRSYTGIPQGYSPWVDQPFFPSHATVEPAQQAYKSVLSDVGCNLPRQDGIDARIIDETLEGRVTYFGSLSGRPGLPDSQSDVGGWANHYPTAERPGDWDSDNDGLPGWWEKIKGLNPNSAANDFSDSNADLDEDGFTNLEDYLNWIARPHYECSRDTHVDIDLAPLTKGFGKASPIYSIISETQGRATLLPNSSIARFTPDTANASLGQFTFQVADTEGDLTQVPVNIHINEPRKDSLTLKIRHVDSQFELEIHSPRAQEISLQTSLDLITWTESTTLQAIEGAQRLEFSPPAASNAQFFRLLAGE